MTDEDDSRNLTFQRGEQIASQGGEPLRLPLQHHAGDPAGFAEPNDVWDIFGAGSPTAFLAGAEQKRRQTDAATDVEHADALRRIEFVTREGKQVQAQRIHVNW